METVMIDESKKKLLLYIAAAFIGLSILAFVVFLLLNKNNDLPPTNIKDAGSSTVPLTADTSEDEARTYKDGIIFIDFNELDRYAIPTYRIDVIRYVLAAYAKEKTIASFVLDKASIEEAKDGERTIFTFNALDNNNNETYKVELSYVFSADAFVRLFDKNGTVVKTSPYETD